MFKTEIRRYFSWRKMVLLILIGLCACGFVYLDALSFSQNDRLQAEEAERLNNLALKKVDIFQQWILDEKQENQENHTNHYNQDFRSSVDFWQDMAAISKSLKYEWTMGNYEQVDKLLQEKEKLISTYWKTGVHPENVQELMKNDPKDYKAGLRFYQVSRKRKSLQHLFYTKPTVGFEIMKITAFNSITYLIFLFVLLMTGDVWAKELETSSYRLLFTMPMEKSSIFGIRTGLSLLASLIAATLLIALPLWFAHSMFGLGFENITLYDGHFITFEKVFVLGSFFLLAVLFFFNSLILILSWFLKDRGFVYMIGCVLLGLWYASDKSVMWQEQSPSFYYLMITLFVGLGFLMHGLMYFVVTRTEVRQ